MKMIQYYVICIIFIITVVICYLYKYDLIYWFEGRKFIFNQRISKRRIPWRVYHPHTENDIIKLYDVARKHKKPVVIHSGGHSYEGLSAWNNSLVIDLINFRNSKVNIRDKIIIIEGGVNNRDIWNLIEKSGNNFVFPTGDCPTVSITGSLLCGGINIFRNTYGLLCDMVLEYRVITPDGKVRNISKKSQDPLNKELFWGLGGGGAGNFGTVVSVKFPLLPNCEIVRFSITWPLKYITVLPSNWIRWLPTSNKQITGDLSIDSKNITFLGMYIGKLQNLKTEFKTNWFFSTEKALKIELYQMTGKKLYNSMNNELKLETEYNSWKNRSVIIRNDVSVSTMNKIKHMLELKLSDDIVCSVHLLSMVGAIWDKDVSDTPFPYRKIKVMNAIEAKWKQPKNETEAVKWVNTVYELMSDVYGKDTYRGWPDLGLKHPLQNYYGSNIDRLHRLKRKIDPENLFRYPQSISV